MGLFDSFKNIVANKASNVIGNAINQVKEEATNTVKEEIKEEIKEKAENAIIGGVKNYLNNAQEKATTSDAKDAINTLQNLVDDAHNAQKAALGEETNEIDYTAKTKEDLVKLGEIADKYNKEQKQ